MLPRILEPEVMDTPAEARDYDAMDHAAVNRAFVTDFLAYRATLGPLADRDKPIGHFLDVGTGTAQIPIELSNRGLFCQVTAIDLAEEMLRVARENLRFERTRVFGRVRRIVLAMGRVLTRRGALEDARDVFHLTIDELLGFAEGNAASRELRALAAVRCAESARYAAAPAPPGRFATRDLPVAPLAVPPPGSIDDTVRTGPACCPGVVRARVRVVRDPRETLRPGEILVAERTDPSWVVLFPAAAAILVERGSQLSHAAIVSREMAIPSVVAIRGLMSWLRDGDLVELDGATGLVRRLERAS